jgi:hypothetical protein
MADLLPERAILSSILTECQYAIIVLAWSTLSCWDEVVKPAFQHSAVRISDHGFKIARSI